MKKLSLFTSIVALLCFARCNETQQTPISLTGEWNILAVGEQIIDTNKEEFTPFIGFDSTTNQIYGNASCNNFFATIVLDSVNSKIQFSNAGSTRMMCANMATEQAILQSLTNVAKYSGKSNGEIQLLNAENQVLFVLRKK